MYFYKYLLLMVLKSAPGTLINSGGARKNSLGGLLKQTINNNL